MAVDYQIIDKLASIFAPNREAQGPMAPIDRNKYYETIPDDARVAAVMALIYPKEGEWHIVYIRRKGDHTDDKHAGQISFPGGKYELEDQDYYHTALRETSEEVGVDPSGVNLIGQLSDLYIPVSNFKVYSYLTFHKTELSFVLDPTEVAGIIEIPIRYLIQPEITGHTDIPIRGGIMKNIPYFDLRGEVLWGATAMLTNEIIYNLKKVL